MTQQKFNHGSASDLFNYLHRVIQKWSSGMFESHDELIAEVNNEVVYQSARQYPHYVVNAIIEALKKPHDVQTIEELRGVNLALFNTLQATSENSDDQIAFARTLAQNFGQYVPKRPNPANGTRKPATAPNLREFLKPLRQLRIEGKTTPLSSLHKRLRELCERYDLPLEVRKSCYLAVEWSSNGTQFAANVGHAIRETMFAIGELENWSGL